MTNKETMALYDQFVMETYRRNPVALEKGKGAKVWDADGKEYLDFLAGIAVCSLGHSNPKVTAAIRKQAGILGHTSNLYYNGLQAQVAKILVENSFADKAFFCNSGAEANEAAIKLVRKYGHEKMGGRYEIITMLNSFHGRTLATITATGQTKFQIGFEPLPGGFKYVPFNDPAALDAAIGDKTCAVMLEPIQAEGGVNVPSDGYLRAVREICDKKGVLMILDEVQTGMGRTGSLFAYEQHGIKPDVMALAKALGNGFPVGAMLATDKVAEVLVPGTHASTFGGNHLAMAACLASLDCLINDGVLENCRQMSDYLFKRINGLKRKHSIIAQIRGKGLLVAIELSTDCPDLVGRCLAKGLLVNCTSPRVMRLVPPLIIKKSDINKAMAIIDEVLAEI
jgi:predicted acetylornithine/succinylornithine family transaminase